MRRKPNRWQRPAQFKRMLQAHVLLRGNGYALKSVSRGEVRELIPLHPDRVRVRQLDSMELEYDIVRRNGTQYTVPQRSEEHTSEIQSLMRISYAVFCLENKTLNKSTTTQNIQSTTT